MDGASLEQIAQILAERDPQVQQALESLRGISRMPSVNDGWWYDKNTAIPEESRYVIRSPHAQEICNTMAGTPGTAHLGCTQRDATLDGQPYAKIVVPDVDPGDNIFNHEVRHAKGYQHR